MQYKPARLGLQDHDLDSRGDASDRRSHRVCNLCERRADEVRAQLPSNIGVVEGRRCPHGNQRLAQPDPRIDQPRAPVHGRVGKRAAGQLLPVQPVMVQR